VAGILGKLAGIDTIREDMRKRVDEILRAGNDWKTTAEKLTGSLQVLIEAIQKGNPQDLQPIKSDLKSLSTQTRRLARAFEAHRETLASLIRKI
jgi:hypothetical protein